MSLHARTTLDAVSAPYGAFLLRITLGVVFLAHGLLKVLVLTLPGTAAFFVAHGFPAWTAYAVFLAEVLGGAGLIAGVYSRVIAIGLIPVLLGALVVHWPNGWYFGAPHGGWEYIAVLLAALLVQAALGDGHLALAVPTKLGRASTKLSTGIVVIATAVARWTIVPMMVLLGVVMADSGIRHGSELMEPGTHHGDLFGIPSTHRKVSVMQISDRAAQKRPHRRALACDRRVELDAAAGCRSVNEHARCRWSIGNTPQRRDCRPPRGEL